MATLSISNPAIRCSVGLRGGGHAHAEAKADSGGSYSIVLCGTPAANLMAIPAVRIDGSAREPQTLLARRDEGGHGAA